MPNMVPIYSRPRHMSCVEYDRDPFLSTKGTNTGIVSDTAAHADKYECACTRCNPRSDGRHRQAQRFVDISKNGDKTGLQDNVIGGYKCEGCGDDLILIGPAILLPQTHKRKMQPNGI